MQFIKKNTGGIILTAYTFLLPAFSLAQGVITNPLGTSGPKTIPEFIKILLEGALQVGIPVIALAVIYCGFLFVKARGNSEELTKAKDALLYTLIGAAILLGSWAIAEMISATVTGLGTGV